MGSARTALIDAVVAALPVALVYFSGWAYLTSYLAQFGIDATQLDISFTTVLVYAFIPLQDYKVISIIFVIIAIGFVAYLLDYYKKITAILGIIIVLLIILFLFVVKSAAAISAKEMADNVWRGDKAQAIAVINPDQKDEPAVVAYNTCRDGRRLRQIIGLSDQMFILCRSNVSPCDRGTMFAINKEGRISYVADKVRGDVNVREICPI